MFCITSEICGNVGISEFPINREKTAVTCIDVLWMSLSVKEMVEYHCAAVLFCSFLMFCLIFVVFFVVVFF